MQRIRLQVDHLQQQLAGLTRLQKIFATALVAVMLAALVWWARHAASDEMVALFEESAQPPADIQRLSSALSVAQIEFKLQGTQVLVPRHKQEDAIRALASQRVLPGNGPNSSMGEAIDKIGSFDAREKIEARLLQAKQDDLKRTIETLPGVASATVHLNPEYRRQIGQSLLPSASVSIATKEKADDHSLAQAVSFLLASAIQGLEPERVTVLIDGALVSAAGEADLLTWRELQLRSEAEHHFEAKVREALPSIPSLTVSVVVGSTSSTRQQPMPVLEGSPDDPLSDAPDRNTAQLASAPQHPLSLADVVTALGAPPPEPLGGNDAANHAVHARPSWTRPSPTSCTLVVPMSWLVQQWQTRNRTTDIPSAEALDQFESAKLDELCRIAGTTLDGLSPQLVSVIVDADSALMAGGAEPIVSSRLEDSTGISALIRDWGREVAVAALAAVSVLLISAMMKKTAPVGGAMISHGGHALASGAGEFAGMELFEGLPGEDSLAAAQVIEHVQALVHQDPDAAAAMVRRWLTA